MRQTRLTLLASLIGLLVFLLPQGALAAPERVLLYFFEGDGCPHCAEESAFLKTLRADVPSLEVRDYEVWKHPENRPLLARMAKAYGIAGEQVPVTFVGERAWVGFNDQVRAELRQAVQACTTKACGDPATLHPTKKAVGSGATCDDPKSLSCKATPGATSPATPPATVGGDKIVVPLLGSIDLAAQPLLVTTVLLALVDGFNPCSLWVMSLLMGIVLSSRSRQKTLAVGLTYLTVTASVYGLFMVGLFHAFALVGFTGWIRAGVAALATGFALVNVKDYFWYKQGLSFTISDKSKPGIYKGIRRVMASEGGLLATVGATAGVALGITVVEFPCTAGFPVVWSNILSNQGVSTLLFLALLAVYLVLYLLDEIVIFLVMVFTLRATRVTEKEGRVLKLVSGMIMLALALALLLRPELMNSLGGSLIVFAVAAAVSGLILLVHRAILPALGVRVAMEPAGGRPR